MISASIGCSDVCTTADVTAVDWWTVAVTLAGRLDDMALARAVVRLWFGGQRISNSTDNAFLSSLSLYHPI